MIALSSTSYRAAEQIPTTIIPLVFHSGTALTRKRDGPEQETRLVLESESDQEIACGDAENCSSAPRADGYIIL